MNNKTNPYRPRALELIAEGKKDREIAEILTREGFTTNKGTEIGANHIYFLRPSAKEARSARIKENRNTMITLPVEDHPTPRMQGKVIAIIASADDVRTFLKDWVA